MADGGVCKPASRRVAILEIRGSKSTRRESCVSLERWWQKKNSAATKKIGQFDSAYYATKL